MAVNAYLIFDGNCKEAMAFYAQVFDSEITELKTFGEAGVPNLSEQQKELILHGRVMVAGADLMFSDNNPAFPYIVGNNITLAVITPDEAYIRSSFAKLQVGGKVHMELQKTFWSDCYGNVADRFGVEWQLSKE
ncbi:VOC family protein [Kurthia sibirica]|uniref:PhnB-like domain-containing protein n=1 Tax=Kurthia sibirica TaxID=202750 RepID=A0A2U3AMD5_9BACL|nr:VOC family protein [Kurthia sibirica]PWI25688.1 hypothetical protein DEX24_07200 [Kurthia sibirica]GEK33693.1 VOC family protein [Kurthia sibirica]